VTSWAKKEDKVRIGLTLKKKSRFFKLKRKKAALGCLINAGRG